MAVDFKTIINKQDNHYNNKICLNSHYSNNNRYKLNKLKKKNIENILN